MFVEMVWLIRCGVQWLILCVHFYFRKANCVLYNIMCYVRLFHEVFDDKFDLPRGESPGGCGRSSGCSSGPPSSVSNTWEKEEISIYFLHIYTAVVIVIMYF